MANCRLDLFGGFRLRPRSGLEVAPLPTAKSKALLAYLALAPDLAHSRDKLSNLLWGDSPERAARHSLAQALSSIRKWLTAETVELYATNQDICLRSEEITCDIIQFESLLAQDTPAALATADGLYQGDLLAGFEDISEYFDTWLIDRRRQLNEVRWAALVKLVRHHRQEGSFETAVAYGLCLLEIDPLAEEIHRALMELYLKQGRRAAAKRQYETCVDLLKAELDVEPEPETMSLYHDIYAAVSPGVPRLPPDGNIAGLPTIGVLPWSQFGLSPIVAEAAQEIANGTLVELTRIKLLRVSSEPKTTAAPDAAYLVSGNVRQDGKRIVFELRLIETATGHHLWAERFGASIGALSRQVRAIPKRVALAALERLETEGLKRSLRETPEELDAYGCYMRGRFLANRYDQHSVANGHRFIEAAVAKDPAFAQALALQAWFTASAGWWQVDPDRYLDEALTMARDAVAIEPHDGEILAMMGYLHLYRRDLRDAERYIDSAVTLSPRSSTLIAHHAQVLNFVGQPKDALQRGNLALEEMRAVPNWHWEGLGLIYFSRRQFGKAIDAFETMRKKNSWNHLQIAACHGQLGQRESAHQAWREFVTSSTARSPESLLQEFYEDPSEHMTWLEGLQKAGLLSHSTFQ